MKMKQLPLFLTRQILYTKKETHKNTASKIYTVGAFLWGDPDLDQRSSQRNAPSVSNPVTLSNYLHDIHCPKLLLGRIPKGAQV